MPLFKRKEKQSAPKGAPEIPGLDLGDNRSLLNLATPPGVVAGAAPADLEESSGGANAQAQMQTRGSNNVISAATAGQAAPPLQQQRKFDTMGDLSSKTFGDADMTNPGALSNGGRGHQRSQSSLSRSMSHGTVPYHLPWTRNLALEEEAAIAEQQNQSSIRPGTRDSISSSVKPSPTTTTTTTPPRRRGAASSSTAAYVGLTNVFNPPQPIDFRTSPNAFPQPTPSQRRQVIDAARKQSLKRSKAPQELNIMLFGGINTGKTSFARALLSTCDLSLCSEESRQAAGMFGITPDPKHVTHETDPITPARTTQYNVLSGVDLHPSALVPIAALEAGVDVNSTTSPRPPSMFSSSRQSSNTAGGGGSGRVQLSICDTPGMDFDLESDFDVERKVAAALRYVEARLQRTLSEESKVQRQPRNDGHIHLILYFIDPRFMLERVATRRARRDQERYLALHGSNAASKGSDEVRRARSTSLFGQGKAPPPIDANLTKEAQTAQLRQSMDALQAKRAPREADKTRPLSRDSVASSAATSTVPLPPDEVPPSTTPLDDTGVEGLSQRQIAILARLSQRTNVLPIIAKADTLTQAQLDDVRTAVRSSIIKANLDLGTFDVDVLRRKKKPIPAAATKISAAAAATDVQRNSGTDAIEATINEAPVKVIRIKSRRSYSATGVDRMSVSVSGHSIADGAGTEDDHGFGGSSLGHTAPLFDSPHIGGPADDEEDDADVPPPVTLARMIPFSLFVPEPVRVRPRLSRSASGSLERHTSMNSIAEVAPPVPPLPRDLVNVKKQAGRPGTATSNQGSDIGSAAGESSVEKEEVLADGESHAVVGDDSNATRQSMESAAVHPSVAPAEQQQQQAPAPSRRFQRDYRFGRANMLDARQCDFALLRMCMLGSHVDALRESTALRYERFRSQRLETRQLTRQTSLTALPSSYITSTSTTTTTTTTK